MAQLPRAVNREGTPPVPVITAPGHCAWPNLKLLKDGRTLGALIFNNDSHGHRPGDIECWLSSDEGAQWTLASAATSHDPETIRMNHAAGLASNGDLLVLTSGWSNLWPAGVPRTRGSFRYEVLGPWLSRSSDSGHTWSVAKDAFPQTTPSGQPAVPFGDIVRAQNGDLCVIAYSPQGPWEKYEERRFRSWLFRSKDDGKSWSEPVVVGPDSNETNIVHLGDGRWLACARSGTGVGKKDFMELYASTDDGRTWKKKRTLTGFQRVNGHLLQLKDGSVLFTYGDRASENGKKGLEAMISRDKGDTWSSALRLADWNGLDGGYPSCVQLADGQIVTAYYSSALPGEPPDSMKGYHMAVIAWDADKSFAKVKGTLAPLVDVPYGSHPRQTIDVWLPKSEKPAPVVFYIHGGGWTGYDKLDIHDHLDVRAFLKAGIAVVSVNYRLLQDANAAHISPPVQWPLGDAARALQFVRSKAAEWHLDKTRIAASGVSAGGCSSLWLAMHDDMADPQSTDPIARESTRLDCAAVKAPVVSLDPKQLREWIPNSIFSAHAFGFADLSRAASFEPFLAEREKHLADIHRYSPYEFASKDDPPVFVEFPNQDKPPIPGDAQTDPNHSAISGLMLERRLKELGVPVELRYKNDGRTGTTNVQEYLTRRLAQPTPARP